jgi:hypothetical protein
LDGPDGSVVGREISLGQSEGIMIRFSNHGGSEILEVFAAGLIAEEEGKIFAIVDKNHM